MIKLTRLCLFLLVLSVSCSGKYSKIDLKDKTSLNGMKCIAILPLDPLSRSSEGASVVKDLVSSNVTSNLIFRTVPPSDVDKELGLMGSEAIRDSQKACDVGKALNAQGIMMGSVTEYGYVRQVTPFSEPRLGFSLALYEVSSCKPLWSATVSKTSSYQGSLSSLAMNSVDGVMQKLSKELGERTLDFRYRCGPRKYEEDLRCARGAGGQIDFEKCPEAIPFLRLGREKVSLEGDEIIFNQKIDFLPGKSMPAPSSHELLGELVKFLNKNNIRRIRIESYVLLESSEGAAREFNRSGEVRKFLVRNGLKNTVVDSVNFTIGPALLKGRAVSNIRIVVLE